MFKIQRCGGQSHRLNQLSSQYLWMRPSIATSQRCRNTSRLTKFVSDLLQCKADCCMNVRYALHVYRQINMRHLVQWISGGLMPRSHQSHGTRKSAVFCFDIRQVHLKAYLAASDYALFIELHPYNTSLRPNYAPILMFGATQRYSQLRLYTSKYHCQQETGADTS